MACVRKPRDKLCESAFHPFKTQKRVPKVGGFAAHFACGFFEFWKGGTRSRIVFLKVFARWILNLSDDNIEVPVDACRTTVDGQIFARFG